MFKNSVGESLWQHKSGKKTGPILNQSELFILCVWLVKIKLNLVYFSNDHLRHWEREASKTDPDTKVFFFSVEGGICSGNGDGKLCFFFPIYSRSFSGCMWLLVFPPKACSISINPKMAEWEPPHQTGVKVSGGRVEKIICLLHEQRS